MDNKVYGLPFAVEGYGFIYNKGIFEAAGIDAKGVKDYASLEAAVKTLDAKIKSGELKSKYPKLEAVFELPAKEDWVTGLHTSNVALSQEFKSSLDAFLAKKVDFKYGDGVKDLLDLQANYSASASSKEQQSAAKDFLNWLYTSDKGKDFVVNKFFFIPALKGYEKFPSKDALGVAISRYVKDGKTLPWIFMGYPTGWGQKVLAVEIQKYLAGQEKWEDVIKNSQAKWVEMRK